MKKNDIQNEPEAKTLFRIDKPEFIDESEWIDQSWCNDVTAHYELIQPADSTFEVWLWVHPAKKSKRESPEYSRYCVEIKEHETGDTLDFYTANTDKQCKKAIADAMKSLIILRQNSILNK